MSVARRLQAYLPPQIGPASDLCDPWASAWFTSGQRVLSARQVPLGILSAYLTYPSERNRAWMLEVHFTQQWPAEACPFEVAVGALARMHLLCNARHMFFNTLKEAAFIRTGLLSSTALMLSGHRLSAL
jgi:hypothetical protein